MKVDFQLVSDNLSFPLLIAKPIRDDQQKITDFQIVYTNNEFQKNCGYALTPENTWSTMEKNVTSGIPFFKIAKDIIDGLIYPDLTFHSPVTDFWFRLDFSYVEQSDTITITFTNITSEHNMYTKLKKSLTTDSLTGLENRNAFSEALDYTLNDARYYKQSVAVLILDIDNLKNINDSLGQKNGDSLILKVANVLKSFSKDHIKLFRYGDDEFAAIIHGYDSIDTIINFVDAIYETFQFRQIEVSGGVSLFPEHSEQKDELIRFSDMAIHYAKKNGKNNFVYFSPEMQRVFIQHLTLQSKMTSAIIECNFRQYYQPQFDIRTGALRGFEALIRWTDTELGEIAPSVFIPLAEETGLIIPIGRWVLKTAISTLKDWQTKYHFKGIMSVNVSPEQLRQDDFLPELQFLIEKYDIIPGSLEVEITEGIFINDMENTIMTLNEIKQLGIRVSLDDFGTGYSSLSYLQLMPLNTLKIDKSFINGITENDGIQANITQSIINMVEKMGLETIAEGVEYPEQLDLLSKFNCKVVQGFLQGKPMPSDMCDKLIDNIKNDIFS